MEAAHPEISSEQAIRMVNRLGDPDRLLTPGQRISELAQFGQAPDQPRPRQHRRQAHHAETAAQAVTLQLVHVATERLYGVLVVAENVVCLAQSVIRPDPQAEVVEALRDVEGAPAVLDGPLDRKSTRLNSSHLVISYAVFCLKKKKRK